MNQIITQHGWGLDQSFWSIYKVEFEKNNWYWQDNERGYYSKNEHQSKWVISNCQKTIKMILCHSLGYHLIQKNILRDATHIVLINSFNNFLPLSNKRNLVIKSLRRMEKKIINCETKEVLKEFVKRSFMPNIINNDFQNIFHRNLDSTNKTLLLKDLKKLYAHKLSPLLINKNCNIIFIQSENDLILDRDSSNNFFNSLNKIMDKKPTLIKLSNQGHCLTNLNLLEIISNNLDNKNE